MSKDYNITNVRYVSDIESIFLKSLSVCIEDIEAYSDLTAEDFYSPLAYSLYSEMVQRRKDSLELVSFDLYKEKSLLNRDEWLFVLDGFNRTDYVDSDSLAHMYKKIKKRRVEKELTHIMFSANDKEMTSIDKLRKITKHVDNAMELSEEKEEYVYIGDTIDKIAKDGEEKNVLYTGFSSIDPYINIKKDNLIVVSARPSVGKTHFVLNVIMNQIREGKKCLFYSLEMGREEIAVRIMRMYSDKNGLSNLYLVDKEKIFKEEIIRDILSQKPDFVVIDQLNKVKCGGKDMREKISNSALELKEVTKKLHIPIIVVAQLNRAGHEEPNLMHLKESGSIEEEADKVIILHRDKINSPTVMDVIIAKNRQGQEGKKILDFNMKTFIISDKEG